MQVPTELTFHGLDPSESAEAAVERWVARLEHLHARITGCRVVIDHHRTRQRDFHVRVRLAARGVELAAAAEHDDIYLAIADAFRAAHQQLRSRFEPYAEQMAS